MRYLLARFLNRDEVAPRSSSDPDLERQHEMLLTPPPVWSRSLIWSLSLGSLVLLAWSVFTKIEETSSLPGQLETLRSEVSIRSPDTAVVSEVKVHQYQQVKLSQVLFVLSREDLEPRLNSLKQKLEMLQDRNYHEQQSLQNRLNQAQAQINLNADIVGRLSALYEQGSVQEVQLLEKQNQLYQSRQDYQTLNEELAKASINYRIEANDVYNQLEELQGRSRQFEILTPIAGTLQKMAVQAKGERVQAGDVLATVVPREALIAAVQVSSRLAGPIAPGKSVDITVDAFPANDFGTLKGEVETISPTTSLGDRRDQSQSQPPAYLARIRISPSGIPPQFPSASLRSGMGLTARVVLKEKPVISLVFDFVRDLFKPMADRR